MSEEVSEVPVEEVEEAPAPRREVLSWKQKALRIYEQRQHSKEQQVAMNLLKNVDQFRDQLGQLLGKEYELDGLRVELDGVTFVGKPANGPGVPLEVMMEFRCKNCGNPQLQHIRGLGDIGSILNGGGEHHIDCPAETHEDGAAKEPTADQKLIKALRDFLAAELEEV